MPLIDRQTVFGNADARLARGFLEIDQSECEDGATWEGKKGRESLVIPTSYVSTPPLSFVLV